MAASPWANAMLPLSPVGGDDAALTINFPETMETGLAPALKRRLDMATTAWAPQVARQPAPVNQQQQQQQQQQQVPHLPLQQAQPDAKRQRANGTARLRKKGSTKEADLKRRARMANLFSGLLDEIQNTHGLLQPGPDAARRPITKEQILEKALAIMRAKCLGGDAAAPVARLTQRPTSLESFGGAMMSMNLQGLPTAVNSAWVAVTGVSLHDMIYRQHGAFGREPHSDVARSLAGLLPVSHGAGASSVGGGEDSSSDSGDSFSSASATATVMMGRPPPNSVACRLINVHYNRRRLVQSGAQQYTGQWGVDNMRHSIESFPTGVGSQLSQLQQMAAAAAPSTPECKDDGYGEFRRILKQMVDREAMSFEVECEFVNAAGHSEFFITIFFLVCDHDGKPLGFRGLCRSASHRSVLPGVR